MNHKSKLSFNSLIFISLLFQYEQCGSDVALLTVGLIDRFLSQQNIFQSDLQVPSPLSFPSCPFLCILLSWVVDSCNFEWSSLFIHSFVVLQTLAGSCLLIASKLKQPNPLTARRLLAHLPEDESASNMLVVNFSKVYLNIRKLLFFHLKNGFYHYSLFFIVLVTYY